MAVPNDDARPGGYDVEERPMTTDDDKIDITGLDKAFVLAALYEHAKPQGLGYMHYLHGMSLSIGEAREILATSPYVDYLHGRVLKVDLSGDAIDPRLYDRDNGPGAAYVALKSSGCLDALP